MNSFAACCVAAVSAGVVASSVWAGPEKVNFPEKYLKGVEYANLDRPDIKQYRVLYTSPDVVNSVRAGKGVPDGAVLTLVQWSVEQNAAGDPVTGPDGRFVKKDIVGYAVMEKRKGWGSEYPATFRNGEWEYAGFLPNGTPNAKANAGIRACFDCHKPHEKQDFVISMAKLAGPVLGATLKTAATNPAPALAGTQVAQAAPAKGAATEAGIEGFKFNPAKIVAAVGSAITWRNKDDSPHQISIVGRDQKTGVLLKGQAGSLTFASAGSYDYICGLHPTMKGQIEVK